MNLYNIRQEYISSGDVYQHLLEMNDLHFPKLSERVNLIDYSEKLSLNATNWIVKDHGKLVAFLSMYCNDNRNKIAYISNVSVLKDYWGKGMAKELVLVAINYSKKMKFKCVKLEVSRTNIAALCLYKSVGFLEETVCEKSIIMILKND